MYMQMKKMGLKPKPKIMAIDCFSFCMRVWGKVCGVLFLTINFCERNKMYKTVRAVRRLYNKSFDMHDAWYRKVKRMCESVLKEMEE